MQITIADDRRDEDFFGWRDLVDVAFDFELISADFGGLTPWRLSGCSDDGSCLDESLTDNVHPQVQTFE
jgi:hypothetical protein